MTKLFLNLQVTGNIETKETKRLKELEKMYRINKGNIKNFFGRLPRKQHAQYIFGILCELFFDFRNIPLKLILKEIREPKSISDTFGVASEILAKHLGIEKIVAFRLMKYNRKKQEKIVKIIKNSNQEFFDLELILKMESFIEEKTTYRDLVRLSKNKETMKHFNPQPKRLKTSSYEGEYQIRFLDHTDPMALELGDMTHCCQHLGGVGESCVIAGIKEPKSGFLVVEKKGSIRAQAWVWESDEKTLVLDSLETADFVSAEKVIRELEKWAETSPYTYIYVGTGSGIGSELEERVTENVTPSFEYDGYTDANGLRRLKPSFALEFTMTDEIIEQIREQRELLYSYIISEELKKEIIQIRNISHFYVSELKDGFDFVLELEDEDDNPIGETIDFFVTELGAEGERKLFSVDFLD